MVVLAGMFGFAAAAFASRTNTVINGISDWTTTASYTDKSFVPGEGDTVIIPADSEVYVNT